MAQTPEDQAMQEVVELLEANPDTSAPNTIAGVVVPSVTSDIPARREKLAILASTGKSKEAVGTQLTHDHVKRLSDKDVEKYYKRYESYVGNKVTSALVDNLITLFTKGVSMVVEVEDQAKFARELKADFAIDHELSNLAGGFAIRCGRYLALANAGFITANNIKLGGDAQPAPTHPTRDSEGYPLEGVDEVGVDLAGTSQER